MGSSYLPLCSYPHPALGLLRVWNPIFHLYCLLAASPARSPHSRAVSLSSLLHFPTLPSGTGERPNDNYLNVLNNGMSLEIIVVGPLSITHLIYLHKNCISNDPTILPNIPPTFIFSTFPMSSPRSKLSFHHFILQNQATFSYQSIYKHFAT